MLCDGEDVGRQVGPKREGEEQLSYASALQAIAMRPALIGQVKVGRRGWEKRARQDSRRMPSCCFFLGGLCRRQALPIFLMGAID